MGEHDCSPPLHPARDPSEVNLSCSVLKHQCHRPQAPTLARQAAGGAKTPVIKLALFPAKALSVFARIVPQKSHVGVHKTAWGSNAHHKTNVHNREYR